MFNSNVTDRTPTRIPANDASASFVKAFGDAMAGQDYKPEDRLVIADSTKALEKKGVVPEMNFKGDHLAIAAASKPILSQPYSAEQIAAGDKIFDRV